jgi:hypothetical protein
MRKTSAKQRGASMRAEYDFSKAVRGKYAKRFKEATNIVVLAPEVAEVFPDSAAVNDALMALVQIARRQPRAK